VAYPKPYGKVGPSTVQADDAAKADVKRRLFEMRDAQPFPAREDDGELKPFGQPLRFDALAQTFFDDYVIAIRNRHEVGTSQAVLPVSLLSTRFASVAGLLAASHSLGKRALPAQFCQRVLADLGDDVGRAVHHLGDFILHRGP
jgi:hypothetical protein